MIYGTWKNNIAIRITTIMGPTGRQSEAIPMEVKYTPGKLS